MIPIIIPCFNRPEELRRTLNSLREADLSDVILILINDASTDEETNRIFHDFNIAGLGIIKYVNAVNKGIKFNLQLGYEVAFEISDMAMNLDSDTLVKRDFVKRLLHLKKQFPDNIITGFNCETKNKNGTERHPVIQKGSGWVKKRSVGGVNMLMAEAQYDKYVKPALSHTDNWDRQACINSLKDGIPVIACSPSVVQHIGFKSSMGHTGTEPPDISDDFDEKINLPNVTLIGVDGNHADLLVKAQEISCKNINFGAIKLLTEIKINSPYHVKIKPILSEKEYNLFVMRELYKYVDTTHLLIIQYDGYIINYTAWDNEFLNYDYIGATWGMKDNMNVGNGGFSLRSKRLMEITATDKYISETFPEDVCICRTYRKYLEKVYDIKFAPEETANRFSQESYGSIDKKYHGALGFHGFNLDFSQSNIPHKPRREVVKKEINHEHPAQPIVQPPVKVKDPFYRW